MDETDIGRLTLRGLETLIKAGRCEPWTDGPDDPHVRNEAYIEAKYRFQTIRENIIEPPET